MLALVPVLLAAGCSSSDRSTAGGSDDGGATGDEVVVASFNFDESILLAELFAQALADAGIPVRRELALGPRELVAPALQQGEVDLVPEYLGSALAWVAPGADLHRDPSELRNDLQRAVDPWDLAVLAPAGAQNQNALVVTRSLSLRHQLSTTSDLRPVAGTLTLGGPPECPERPLCLPGLRERYDLRFERFEPIDGTDRVVRALEEGVVDVGVLFTTDGALADPDLVTLRDDRQLNPPEQVVPLVRRDVLEQHGPELEAALDEVTSRLTTRMLRFLNWRVTVAGNDPADEARGWLLRQGVIHRP